MDRKQIERRYLRDGIVGPLIAAVLITAIWALLF